MVDRDEAERDEADRSAADSAFTTSESERESLSAPRRRLFGWWLLVVPPALLLIVWLALGGWVQWRGGRFESRCVAAQESGQWQQLESVAVAWSQAQPATADPWVYAALAARRLDALDRAAEYIARMPADDPRTPAALLEASDWCFQQLNQPLRSAELCERVLRIAPRTSEAQRRLVFFSAMTLQRQEMIKRARQAIRLGCDTTETYLYLVGADWISFSNAFPLNERWLENDPSNELFLVARVLQYVRIKGIDDGAGVDPEIRPEKDAQSIARDAAMLAELEALLERFPHNLEVLAHFLRIACIEGDTTRVAKLLSQAPPEAIGDSRFWRFRGWLLAANDQVTEAESAYRKALELHPFDWHSQHELAGVLRRGARFEQVEKLQARALEGKNLRKEILQLPNVQVTPPELLTRIALYAQDCGDSLVAEGLMRRVANGYER